MRTIARVFPQLAIYTLFALLASLARAQTILPPVANAGPDIQVNEGDFVILDGSGSSDPQGLPLTYVWAQLSGAQGNDVSSCGGGLTGGLPSPPCQDPHLDVLVPSVGGLGGIMTFQLTVTNTAGLSASTTINIVIKTVNRAPVAALINPPTQVAGGGLVTLDGSASFDPDGDALTYTWVQLQGPAVSLDLTNPAKPIFLAPDAGATYTMRFELTVSDGQVTSSIVASFQVVAAHHPPVANAGSNQTVGFGTAVTLDGTASIDADGNPLTYTWTQTAGPAVALNLTDPGRPTFTAPSTTSTLTFSLLANDVYLSSGPSTVNVYVYPPGTIPNCSAARANKTQLWPPNDTFSRIKFRGLEADPRVVRKDDDGDDGEGAADQDDLGEDTSTLSIHVNGITQDEPTAGLTAGDTGPDAIVQTTRPNNQQRKRDLILVRRQRASGGDGRIYGISFTATDSISQASCTGKVQVCVPTKKGKNGMCTDSGQQYNALQ